MKAVVFTLGCKVNECESDSIMAQLEKKGYEVTDKLVDADLYIVNTCAVTSEAEKKSRQMVSRIRKLNKTAKIIFTGCATQKNPQAFISKDENFLVTGTFDKGLIVDCIDDSGVKIAEQTCIYENLEIPKTLKSRAFIKVQDGCNNFCSYCIIPYLRGRTRSRNPQSVVDEINCLNPKEAVITGINLSSYNYEGITLTGLMKALKDVDTRIRLGSLEVNVINDEFLASLKNLKDFAPHFHLSLQSGSDSVLKAMNRHYTSGEFIEKVDLIRTYFPNAGITTDIIVGFPTETEQNFEETLRLVDRVNFADIHAFSFSARSGTSAYKMPDLFPEIKKQRLNRLLALKQGCKDNFANKMIGKEERFLPEQIEDGLVVGYLSNYLRAYLDRDCVGEEIDTVVIKEKYKDGVKIELVK